MHLEDFNTETQYEATLLESHRITAPESKEEVRELTLDIDAANFEFKIGQNVGVMVPGPHDFGNEVHFRLYTIADIPTQSSGGHPQIKLCVRRCFYIDEYSGEAFPGVASNYLCDLEVGQHITLTGPYGLPFEVPDDKNADILMIGMGTGIAPFRAFVKHIYHTLGGWNGQVKLFYGAHTGLEMLYMNDQRNDFANYYDEDTFEAFKALSPRPYWNEPAALDEALAQHEKAVWEMINKSDTYVYVAGQESILSLLDKAFSKMAGSEVKWLRKKAELQAGHRWLELLYDS